MRFHRDSPKPRGWQRLTSSTWLCLECQKDIRGDSPELLYMADLDYVFHNHQGMAFRSIKVKRNKEGMRVSLPGITFEDSEDGSLSITGVSAHSITTPDLSFYPPSTQRSKQSFQDIDDIERAKATIEGHPAGISRKEIAEELNMSHARVRKAVKKILENESRFSEKKRRITVTSEDTPEWWKTMKRDLE